ncbi:hypothetical protein Tco_0856757 [Tanacetum coccineum]|uniref:Uncharacterized protein n=1 Tax=Tanacetum coccineum TaxID=301880 RepID=A0ABQ5B4P8_9ASTR
MVAAQRTARVLSRGWMFLKTTSKLMLKCMKKYAESESKLAKSNEQTCFPIVECETEVTKDTVPPTNNGAAPKCPTPAYGNALILMPKFASTLKSLIGKLKKKIKTANGVGHRFLMWSIYVVVVYPCYERVRPEKGSWVEDPTNFSNYCWVSASL